MLFGVNFKTLVMEKKDTIISNMFLCLLIIYSFVINYQLMLSMLISVIIIIFLIGDTNYRNSDMAEDILMNNETSDEELKRYLYLIVMTLVLFCAMIVMCYHWMIMI